MFYTVRRGSCELWRPPRRSVRLCVDGENNLQGEQWHPSTRNKRAADLECSKHWPPGGEWDREQLGVVRLECARAILALGRGLLHRTLRIERSGSSGKKVPVPSPHNLHTTLRSLWMTLKKKTVLGWRDHSQEGRRTGRMERKEKKKMKKPWCFRNHAMFFGLILFFSN